MLCKLLGSFKQIELLITYTVYCLNSFQQKSCNKECNKLPTTVQTFREFFACFHWKILEPVSTSEEQIESELQARQVDYF